MKTLKVESLKSPRTGNPVANQFMIKEKTKNKSILTFQSYNTIICKLISTNKKNTIILDVDALNYSRTTSKHLYSFLDSFGHLNFGMRKKEILKAIKNNEIQTKNLN